MSRGLKEKAGEANKLLRNPPDIMGDDRVFLAWHRSHLANERTFLSWCRTSIALIVFGFVMERLESSKLLQQATSTLPWFGASSSREMSYLALLCFGLAAATILISGFRFLRVRRHINRGEAVFSVLPDLLVIIAVIIVVSFAIALSIPRMEAIPWPSV